MDANARLDELLKRWRQLRRAGQMPVLEELCRDCPELLPALRERIEEAPTITRPTIAADPTSNLMNVATGSYHTDQSRSIPRAELVSRSPSLTPLQTSLLDGADVSGTMLGEYALLERIGVGGMGAVYKARHRRLDRIVAVKLLAKSCVDSPEAIARFQREGRAAARLIHPNVVLAYDAGAHDGVHYLVMEFIAGTDLARRVRQHGRLPLEQALDCAVQAARALEYAHAQGVVHRDVKPSNLLLDDKGVVKLLDLGLARLRPRGSDSDPELTQTGMGLGTPDYAAPEQNIDPANADERADIYSLGCTLFSLLTARPMYSEKAVTEKILAHREQPLPSLQQYRPEVPPVLEAVFRRMVAKDPRERYATMTEVHRELEACRPATAAATPLVAGRGLWFVAAGVTLVALLTMAVGGVWFVAHVLGKAPHKDDSTAAEGQPSAMEAPGGISGSWKGLTHLDNNNAQVSELEIVEAKDGALTGKWDGATLGGRHSDKDALRWQCGRRRDGYEYHATGKLSGAGEALELTFTPLRKEGDPQDLIGGIALLVRPPGPPVTKRVVFAGQWRGLTRFDDGAGDIAMLVLMEAKDGSLSGVWDRAETSGKRTGDATFEIAQKHPDGYDYEARFTATNGGQVLRAMMTGTRRDPKGKVLDSTTGTQLLIRDE